MTAASPLPDLDTSMGRRSVLAALASVTLAGSAKAAPAEFAFPVVKPGTVLVGFMAKDNRIISPGKVYSVAEYNAAFGANFRPGESAWVNCVFKGNYIFDSLNDPGYISTCRCGISRIDKPLGGSLAR